MPARVREMIPIRQFSSGRRTVVLERVREVAERRGLAQIVAHIDRALAHERATRGMENRWSSRDRGRLHDERLPAIDNKVDQVLTGIRDIAAGQARGLADDHPVAVQVAEFLDEIFPYGVQAVTALPFMDQVLAVETIVARLQNGMAATASALGLDARVAQLAALTAEYRRLVRAGRGDMDYPSVREARERGQLYLRELIGMIIGTFFDSDVAGHVAARDELLAPISEQLARLRARARARVRRPEEVEAEPGEGGDGEAEAGEPEAGEPGGAGDGEVGDEALNLAGEIAAERAADLADGIAVSDDGDVRDSDSAAVARPASAVPAARTPRPGA